MCYMIVSCWVYFNSKPSAFMMNASALECAENTVRNGGGVMIAYQTNAISRTGRIDLTFFFVYNTSLFRYQPKNCDKRRPVSTLESEPEHAARIRG